METSTVRLRALIGSPLADGKVKGTVVSTAHAIAERTGVEIIDVVADDSSITVTLVGDRITGVGFLAELRRLTNTWFAAKHAGQSLWGDAPPEATEVDDESDQGWRPDPNDDDDEDDD